MFTLNYGEKVIITSRVSEDNKIYDDEELALGVVNKDTENVPLMFGRHQCNSVDSPPMGNKSMNHVRLNKAPGTHYNYKDTLQPDQAGTTNDSHFVGESAGTGPFYGSAGNWSNSRAPLCAVTDSSKIKRPENVWRLIKALDGAPPGSRDDAGSGSSDPIKYGDELYLMSEYENTNNKTAVFMAQLEGFMSTISGAAAFGKKMTSDQIYGTRDDFTPKNDGGEPINFTDNASVPDPKNIQHAFLKVYRSGPKQNNTPWIQWSEMDQPDGVPTNPGQIVNTGVAGCMSYSGHVHDPTGSWGPLKGGWGKYFGFEDFFEEASGANTAANWAGHLKLFNMNVAKLSNTQQEVRQATWQHVSDHPGQTGEGKAADIDWLNHDKGASGASISSQRKLGDDESDDPVDWGRWLHPVGAPWLWRGYFQNTRDNEDSPGYELAFGENKPHIYGGAVRGKEGNSEVRGGQGDGSIFDENTYNQATDGGIRANVEMERPWSRELVKGGPSDILTRTAFTAPSVEYSGYHPISRKDRGVPNNYQQSNLRHNINTQKHRAPYMDEKFSTINHGANPGPKFRIKPWSPYKGIDTPAVDDLGNGYDADFKARISGTHNSNWPNNVWDDQSVYEHRYRMFSTQPESLTNPSYKTAIWGRFNSPLYTDSPLNRMKRTGGDLLSNGTQQDLDYKWHKDCGDPTAPCDLKQPDSSLEGMSATGSYLNGQYGHGRASNNTYSRDVGLGQIYPAHWSSQLCLGIGATGIDSTWIILPGVNGTAGRGDSDDELQGGSYVEGSDIVRFVLKHTVDTGVQATGDNWWVDNQLNPDHYYLKRFKARSRFGPEETGSLGLDNPDNSVMAAAFKNSVQAATSWDKNTASFTSHPQTYRMDATHRAPMNDFGNASTENFAGAWGNGGDCGGKGRYGTKQQHTCLGRYGPYFDPHNLETMPISGDHAVEYHSKRLHMEDVPNAIGARMMSDNYFNNKPGALPVEADKKNRSQLIVIDRQTPYEISTEKEHAAFEWKIRKEELVDEEEKTYVNFEASTANDHIPCSMLGAQGGEDGKDECLSQEDRCKYSVTYSSTISGDNYEQIDSPDFDNILEDDQTDQKGVKNLINLGKFDAQQILDLNNEVPREEANEAAYERAILLPEGSDEGEKLLYKENRCEDKAIGMPKPILLDDKCVMVCGEWTNERQLSKEIEVAGGLLPSRAGSKLRGDSRIRVKRCKKKEIYREFKEDPNGDMSSFEEYQSNKNNISVTGGPGSQSYSSWKKSDWELDSTGDGMGGAVNYQIVNDSATDENEPNYWMYITEGNEPDNYIDFSGENKTLTPQEIIIKYGPDGSGKLSSDMVARIEGSDNRLGLAHECLNVGLDGVANFNPENNMDQKTSIKDWYTYLDKEANAFGIVRAAISDTFGATGKYSDEWKSLERTRGEVEAIDVYTQFCKEFISSNFFCGEEYLTELINGEDSPNMCKDLRTFLNVAAAQYEPDDGVLDFSCDDTEPDCSSGGYNLLLSETTNDPPDPGAVEKIEEIDAYLLKLIFFPAYKEARGDGQLEAKYKWPESIPDEQGNTRPVFKEINEGDGFDKKEYIAERSRFNDITFNLSDKFHKKLMEFIPVGKRAGKLEDNVTVATLPEVYTLDIPIQPDALSFQENMAQATADELAAEEVAALSSSATLTDDVFDIWSLNSQQVFDLLNNFETITVGSLEIRLNMDTKDNVLLSSAWADWLREYEIDGSPNLPSTPNAGNNYWLRLTGPDSSAVEALRTSLEPMSIDDLGWQATSYGMENDDVTADDIASSEKEILIEDIVVFLHPQGELHGLLEFDNLEGFSSDISSFKRFYNQNDLLIHLVVVIILFMIYKKRKMIIKELCKMLK